MTEPAGCKCGRFRNVAGAIREAVAQERERCAKLLIALAEDAERKAAWRGDVAHAVMTGIGRDRRDMAAAIRATPEEPPHG